MKRTARLWIITLVMLILIAGCGGQSGEGGARRGDEKLRVVTTTGMITDAVRNIAGDLVHVDGLMGAGVDPHLYKASKGDIDLLEQADLVFYNGLMLEAKMAEVFTRMKRVKTTVAIGDAIPDSLLRFPSEFEGHPDPHIWFDLSLWRMATEQVMLTLVRIDSQHADQYQANGGAYLDSIIALHEWVREQVATIPKEKRVLVTAHDAFGYFGRAYNIEVAGLQGISTVSEAGLYDVAHMVDMLVNRNIKAIFVESSVPKKAIESVVEGCRERNKAVTIGGELFSDAMGAEGTVEGTYFGMVRHNVNTIVRALK